jgi:hypothetical protein
MPANINKIIVNTIKIECYLLEKYDLNWIGLLIIIFTNDSIINFTNNNKLNYK